MKRALAVVLFLSSFAFGQASLGTGNPVVTNGLGQPIPGATVAVCTTNPGSPSTGNCSGSTLATTFTDVTGAHACTGSAQPLNNSSSPTVGSGCSNPGFVDGMGNVVVYSGAGQYWCEEYGGGIVGISVVPCIFPATTSGLQGTNNNFTGSNTFGLFNNEFWVDGVKFATCQAAVTAAGSSKALIYLPSNYTGAACPVTGTNILVIDESGTFNPSSQGLYFDTYNFTDGNVYALHRSNFKSNSFGGTNAALVNGYYITALENFTVGSGNTVDGISAEADTFLTFTGTLPKLQAAEHSCTINSTGGTVTQCAAVVGYCNTGAGATTALVTCIGIYGRGGNSILGSTPSFSYGLYGEDQTGKCSVDCASVFGKGRMEAAYSAAQGTAGYDMQSSDGVRHLFCYADSSSPSNTVCQALTANGLILADSGANNRARVNSSGFNVFNGANPHIIGTNATTVRQAQLIDDSLTVGGVKCSTSQKAESGADSNVITCTPLSAAGSYRIRFVMSVSAANTATLGWTATWTDSSGNAQTPTNLALFQSGTAAPALTFTTSAAGNYYGYADIDTNAAGANIVIKLTFSGTSFTAKVSATVERVI